MHTFLNKFSLILLFISYMNIIEAGNKFTKQKNSDEAVVFATREKEMESLQQQYEQLQSAKIQYTIKCESEAKKIEKEEIISPTFIFRNGKTVSEIKEELLKKFTIQVPQAYGNQDLTKICENLLRIKLCITEQEIAFDGTQIEMNRILSHRIRGQLETNRFRNDIESDKSLLDTIKEGHKLVAKEFAELENKEKLANQVNTLRTLLKNIKK